MKPIPSVRGGALLFLLVAGCGPGVALDVPQPQPQPQPQPTSRAPETAPAPAVSGDTPQDRRFAEFVGKTVGGMVSDVAVGIERKEMMQVVLTGQTAPEDTLPLTKSLVAGARQDFPDQRFTLTVFDPSKQPVLKAHVDPDQGVRYQVVQDDPGAAAPASRASAPEANRAATDKDRRFSDWALDKGRDFLRYVEADLERHGRLWFGVTRAVPPADVPELTRSLLEGARAEFPRRELTATVFDPEGEKIGSATLDADGQIRWSR
ncbi:MAG TPA: hypothetical protein VF590_18490 [Isosphaeraceae bacterium]|jgi:hypothetical protein